MTNVQPNLLKLAKQGDPKAIAALMNRSLQPKGVTAKVAFKDSCLQIMLESAPIGKLMASEFPNVPKSIIHGLYEFDTVLSALWIRAGELTYELDEILNKPVDLETLKLKKLEVVTQSSTSSPTPGFSTPTPITTNSARVVTSHVASDDKKILAGIFAILLGTLGIHKFILGYTKEGVIMLLVTLFTAGYGAFIMAIVSIIEGVIYLTKSDREFVQTYVSSKKGWF